MDTKQDHSIISKNIYLPNTLFYGQIIDSLQDYSIFTLDNDFIINSWSSGSTKIFGYENDEVIGQHFDLIFTEEDIKNGIPKKEINTALKEGRATDNRWHIAKDRSVFYAYGLVFPLIDLEGEMIGYVKILRDLTDKKRSADTIKRNIKELEDLNAHKENVLALLSHDLRSPLTSIISTAKYLKDNFQKMKPQDVQEMLDLLHQSSNNELEMLDYLVEWARVKYASDVFSPTKIELTQYIDKVFETLNETALTKTITLHHKIKDNIFVFADGKMLISIIQNIVSNAIKHSEKGGTITVSAKRKEDEVTVLIKDTGVGIAQEMLGKLFTPQMKPLSEARKKNKGAGIGLLLVKGFLEKNGGDIWVESIEGEGSSFYFTLPTEKPAIKVSGSDPIMFDEVV
jgi:PAS domain S-box-containing protein